MKNIGTCYLQLELGNISDKVKWGYLAQFWENCMIARAMESSIMINRFVSVKHNVIKLLTIRYVSFLFYFVYIFGVSSGWSSPGARGYLSPMSFRRNQPTFRRYQSDEKQRCSQRHLWLPRFRLSVTSWQIWYLPIRKSDRESHDKQAQPPLILRYFLQNGDIVLVMILLWNSITFLLIIKKGIL